jgi:hypothetical protein
VNCVICDNKKKLKDSEAWYLGNGYALCRFHGNQMLAKHPALFNAIQRAIDKEARNEVQP